MSQDSKCTTHRVVVPFENLHETQYLLPFGDIHRDSKNCHVQMWKEYCKWAALKPRSLFLGMGDYFDGFSDSERRGLNHAELHDSSNESLDDWARGKVEQFANEIGFMKGRVVGLLEGNHFYEFADGTTSTQYLCQLLGCKFLSWVSLVRLVYEYTKGNKTSAIDIFACHGKGASRLVGGSLNTVQQMQEIADADIYLMGHDHKKSIAMTTRLGLNNAGPGVHLKDKKKVYARTGSFLMGYAEDRPSYVAKALLTPNDLGTVKIELTPKLKNKGSLYIDMHGSI